MTEGEITVVRSRAGDGVSDHILSWPEQYRMGGSVGDSSSPTLHPALRGGSYLSSFLPFVSHPPLIPSGGMPGGGNQPYQPLGSLCALPRTIFHCDPEVHQLALTSMP